MENLCHTFTGAALAKAGLERLTPLAMPTLLIGANLPDIDIVSALWGPEAYLNHHRGITHSLVGTLALSALLALAMFLFDRVIRQRSHPAATPTRLARLMLVSLIGVGSHPLLDYTNSYGIRPFLPWQNQWHYGDLVFIVDPWLWVILGGAVFLLTSQTRPRLIGWGLLWGLMTLIVLGAHLALTQQPYGPMGLAWLWALLLTGLVYARWAGVERYGRKLAGAALIATIGYWGALAGLHHVALNEVKDISQSATEGQMTTKHAALPRPATPFTWDALFETPEEIFYGVLSVTSSPASPQPLQRFPKRLDDPLVRQALNTCAGATMLQFSRYLFAEVNEETGGHAVILRDARYEREETSGFGATSIPLLDANDDCNAGQTSRSAPVADETSAPH